MQISAGPPYPGTICDVEGIAVGHSALQARPSGCTVVLAQGPHGRGAAAGVDVRGAAPGTRETDLLAPGNLVDEVHTVLLAGGSAWGLEAASGVMRWLEENGRGLRVGDAPGQRVPIVPAAVLFDLHLGDARLRPDADAGHAACRNANREATPQGNVGAGAGASVGKLFGMHRAMKGGLGTASLRLGSVVVGALLAVNALGDVRDPETGRILAGARTADGRQLCDSTASILAGEVPQGILPGRNTTIGVIASNARLGKAQCMRLAGSGHDGLARAIHPVHTMSDGDTLFALATGEEPPTDFNTLCIMAAAVVARACANAVWLATSLQVGDLWLPSAHELQDPHLRGAP